MEIGFQVTQRGPGADREIILELARLGEELGYDSLWVGDHVVIPRQVESPYPYTTTHQHPFALDLSYLEALTVLSFLAACTRRPRLGVSVLIVPQRNPVLTAKVLASLDALSQGRIIFGVGAGWLREEFEALDMPFEKR
ncbi:MAG: LLM class flavin-dependent oxidoreductase, partial [Dehalococcoidia bacterium]